MLEQIAESLYVDPAAVVAVEVRFNDHGFPAWEVIVRHNGGAISTIERFITGYGGVYPGETVANAERRNIEVYNQQEAAAHEAADRYTKWVNDRK